MRKTNLIGVAVVVIAVVVLLMLVVKMFDDATQPTQTTLSAEVTVTAVEKVSPTSISVKLEGGRVLLVQDRLPTSSLGRASLYRWGTKFPAQKTAMIAPRLTNGTRIRIPLAVKDAMGNVGVVFNGNDVGELPANQIEIIAISAEK